MIAALLLTTSSLMATPPATDKEMPAKPQEARSEAEFSGGLWPSPKLTNLMLIRWADQMGYQYELEEDQQKKLRKAVVDRWGPFLTKNRSRLEPIVNEFLEMRLELEPPTKERLKVWADKTLPAFELVNSQIGEAKSDLREILTPLQRIEFEVHAMEFGLGLKMAESRIRRLQSGDFEPTDFREFWQPTAAERKRRREARAAADVDAKAEEMSTEESNAERKRADESNPADPILAELDEWEKYVTDFVRLYQFDDGQRTTATSLLTELRLRAMTHRDRKRDQIARLEYRIANADGSDQEMEQLEKQLTELYGPIDEMFQELKGRIELIPTGEQRASAAMRKKKRDESAKEEQSNEKPESKADQKP